MIRGHFRHPWRAPGHGRDDPIPHAGAEATSVRGGGVGAGWPPSEPGRADGGCARRNASSWVRLNGAGGLREASHGQATAWPVADSRAGQRSGVSARDVGGAAVVLERRADPDGDQARHREGGRRCQPAPAIRCSPPVRRAGPAAQGASSSGACRRGGHRLRAPPRRPNPSGSYRAFGAGSRAAPRGRRAAFTSSTSQAPAEAHRRGSDNRGYVNRDPLPARSPGAGWGYFLAAFFLRSAQ